MEINLGRGISLATLIALMILLDTCSSQAASFASLKEKINATATIAEINMESEFLMDSDIGRLLLDYRYLVSRSNIRMQPIVNCNRGNAYRSCLPPKNQPIRPERCGIYKRKSCS
ncbi:Uncharacterized protein TCM_018873 [Theobroma cacao]|uniref:Uncharacterized protein n=1 Tax=Theobroma cacao TaxID=3641 RepID=A0A061EGI0_THECC|nr:Uncharacterized protein TCM_018873 [Theobroma cacao]